MEFSGILHYRDKGRGSLKVTEEQEKEIGEQINRRTNTQAQAAETQRHKYKDDRSDPGGKCSRQCYNDSELSSEFSSAYT